MPERKLKDEIDLVGELRSMAFKLHSFPSDFFYRYGLGDILRVIEGKEEQIITNYFKEKIK